MSDEEEGNVYLDDASDYDDGGGLVPISAGSGSGPPPENLIAGHDITPLVEEDEMYLDAMRRHGAPSSFIEKVKHTCWACLYGDRGELADNPRMNRMLKVVRKFNALAVTELNRYKVVHACMRIKDQFSSHFNRKKGRPRHHFLLRNIALHYLTHDQSTEALVMQDKQAHAYFTTRLMTAYATNELSLEKVVPLFVKLSNNFHRYHGAGAARASLQQ